jgi:hypothetical protein
MCGIVVATSLLSLARSFFDGIVCIPKILLVSMAWSGHVHPSLEFSTGKDHPSMVLQGLTAKSIQDDMEDMCCMSTVLRALSLWTSSRFKYYRGCQFTFYNINNLEIHTPILI